LKNAVTADTLITSERWNLINSQIGAVSSEDGSVALLINGNLSFGLNSSCTPQQEGDVYENIDVAVDSTLVKMGSYCNSEVVLHTPITKDGAVLVIAKFMSLSKVKVFNSSFTTTGFAEAYQFLVNQKPAI
jgi:hypothetical protein